MVFLALQMKTNDPMFWVFVIIALSFVVIAIAMVAIALFVNRAESEGDALSESGALELHGR